MFFKIGVLEDFAIFTGKHLCLQVSFKETPTQVFSCEYCEIFKKSFFHRTPLVVASENLGYDFNCKFIPETAIESPSKHFPLCFLQSFVSEKERKLSTFIRTKNHVNMEMPIDSFIDRE